MPGAYTIVISATDLASGVFDAANKRVEALNKRVAAATAPFRRFGESLEKFSKVTGLTEIATGFGNVARTGTDAFRSLSRIVEPLAAIIGVSSIAGIYKLTTAWGEFASVLGNQAQRAGASASQLYVLQNAARLAGVDAETLTGGITALNDNLRNAAFGGAPAFLNVLSNLGISFEDLQRMNPEQRLKVLADALAKVRSPTDRALFTKELFGGEGIIPFLNAGAAGISAWEEAARRLGGTMTPDDIARAQALRQAQVGLAESVTGLGNAIANILGPALTPLLSETSGVVASMREWIEVNQDWLRNEISTKVGEFVTWLKSVDWHAVWIDLEAIGAKANAVAEALGGWERVGEGVVAFFVGSWFLRMAAPFASLGIAVAQLAFAVGKTLVLSFVAAGDAAVAFEAKAGLAFATASKALGIGARLGIGGFIAHETLDAVDPGDHIGAWIDRTIPGAAAADDWVARHLGFGRTYEQQRQVEQGRSMGSSTPTAHLIYPGAGAQGGDGARNVRNNNPTNLTYAGQPGASSDGRFARFPNLESGVAADLNQFLLYQERDGQRSIADMIHKATPASENPGVEGYIDQVSREMGMGRNEAPNLHDRDVARRFIRAIAAHEGGIPDEAATQRGVDLRLGPAAALPSAIGGSPSGAPGATGRVDLNVRVLGDTPTAVTGRASGDVDLRVAQPGMLFAQ